MENLTQVDGILRQYGLAVLSGILLAMSYAMQPFWWAAWLAPAPLIVATFRAPAPRRRSVSLLAGVIAGVSSFSYHLTVGGWAAALLILVLVALAWSNAVRLAVIFAERRQFLCALLAVPVAWAAIDTFLIHLSPHGSAGSIAYSQMNALPVIQVASLGGLPAITFVVLLGGSLLGLLLLRKPDWGRRSKVSATALAILTIVAAVLFGTARLHRADDALGPRVSMIAKDGVKPRPSSWDAFWQLYGSEISQGAVPGSIVVLPEAILSIPDAYAGQTVDSLAAFAARTRSTIVIGVSVEGTLKPTNRALIARPDGSYYWYVKQHLVPGFEAGTTPGTKPLVFADSLGPIGVAICKDMHFPTLMRDYSKQGARLMLVPANDFEVDDWLTARMTVLRGVESGSSIARAARGGGISFVSDRYGRVIAERRSSVAMSQLTARVPLDSGRATLYALFGDVFGWGCLAVWAVLVVLRYRRV